MCSSLRTSRARWGTNFGGCRSWRWKKWSGTWRVSRRGIPWSRPTSTGSREGRVLERDRSGFVLGHPARRVDRRRRSPRVGMWSGRDRVGCRRPRCRRATARPRHGRGRRRSRPGAGLRPTVRISSRWTYRPGRRCSRRSTPRLRWVHRTCGCGRASGSSRGRIDTRRWWTGCVPAVPRPEPATSPSVSSSTAVPRPRRLRARSA